MKADHALRVVAARIHHLEKLLSILRTDQQNAELELEALRLAMVALRII